MIKHEVIQRIVASPGNWPYYVFFIDRVMITLQPDSPPGDQRVEYYPRVDDDIFTLTDLARSLPETDYSAKMLGQKIVEAQEADVRDHIARQRFRWHKCSSADKRRILLNLKPGINTTEELMKKSTDLAAERSRQYTYFMELHLMSLEDLLNLFSGSGDDDAKARAKLLALCI